MHQRIWAQSAPALLLLAYLTICSLPASLAAGSDLKERYQAAQKAFENGRLDEAQKRFEQVIAESYFQRGRLRRARGHPEQAVEDLEWADKVSPGNPEIWAELGLAYFSHQQFDLAEARLKAALGAGVNRPEVAATLGQTYVSLSDFDAGRKYLEQAVRLNPQDHLSAYLLGLVQLQQKNLPSAKRIFAQLKQAVGESAQFHLLVGRAYEDTDYFQEGDRELRQALALDPKIHYAHHLLALSALKQHDAAGIGAAQRDLEIEIKDHPGEFAPLFLLGVVMEMKRDWPRANDRFQQARELDPEDADVYFHLGKGELEVGNAAAAARDLERCISLTKEKSHAQFQVARAHFQLSRAYLLLGDAQRSAAEAQRAKELSSESFLWEREKMAEMLKPSEEKMRRRQLYTTWTELSPPAQEDPAIVALERMYTQVLANSHNRLALIAARRNQLDEATREFSRVVELQPAFPRGYFNLGLAAFRTHRLPEAIQALQRAVADNPDDSRARQLLGLAQFEHGDFSEALANLSAAQAAHPDDPQLLLALGTCLIRAGRLPEAARVFDRLLTAHSNMPEVHLFLGQAAYAEGRTPDAEAELHRALEIDPRAPQAHFFLGFLALERGDLPGAEAEFRAELQAHPDDQRARYHLAYVLLQQLKRDQGVRLLEEVLQAAPGYQEAHYSLGKALVEEGQLEHGLKELQEAVRLDPDKPYSHYQLGRAYQKVGNFPEAQREMALARELKDRGQKTLAGRGQQSEP